MKPNWTLPPTVPDSVVAELGFPRAQSQLLYNRNLKTRAAAEAFLSPSASDMHDPALLPDMDAATRRLSRAVAERELICVYGDFDMDGISGTAVLSTALRRLGGRVAPYLPNRMSEGHGLNERAVADLADRGVSVIVTVDCGGLSDPGHATAAARGVDMIVTDHHTVTDMPPYPVAALVNPHRPDNAYPFPELTGAGMAYKLAQALFDDAGRDEPTDLLALAALGTVGDVGPLVDENRYIVSEGIRRMNDARSVGLSALAQAAGLGDKDLDAEALVFQIIPRLNAPGRLGDPGISLELLSAEDELVAREMAERLNYLNVERRELTEAGVEKAQAQVSRRYPYALPEVVMVGSRTWKNGVVGLIAARLAESRGKPAVVLSVGEHESRASARSVPGCNIHSILQERSHLMTRFGGHAQAAGFTIPNDNLPELAEYFESLSIGLTEPMLPLDMRASPSTAWDELFGFTEKLAPFGKKGNPKPLFAALGLQTLGALTVGKGGAHLKLRLRDGETAWDAIAFRQGSRLADLNRSRGVDIAYSMERNTFRGRARRQLVVEDLAPSN